MRRSPSPASDSDGGTALFDEDLDDPSPVPRRASRVPRESAAALTWSEDDLQWAHQPPITTLRRIDLHDPQGPGSRFAASMRTDSDSSSQGSELASTASSQGLQSRAPSPDAGFELHGVLPPPVAALQRREGAQADRPGNIPEVAEPEYLDDHLAAALAEAKLNDMPEADDASDIDVQGMGRPAVGLQELLHDVDDVDADPATIHQRVFNALPDIDDEDNDDLADILLEEDASAVDDDLQSIAADEEDIDSDTDSELEEDAVDCSLHEHQFYERKLLTTYAVFRQHNLRLHSRLDHVKHCLSPERDHVAALRTIKSGEQVLSVYWLGAPEEVLRPVQEPVMARGVPLQKAMSIDPPWGSLAVTHPKRVGEIFEPTFVEGTVLLAAQFEAGRPRREFVRGQEQWLDNYVTAAPPTLPGGAQQVTCHWGPAFHRSSQILGSVRNPQAQFSPHGDALVLQSLEPKQNHVRGPQRVLDGVLMFVRKKSINNQVQYVRKMMNDSNWRGQPAPVFAWTAMDQRTVVAANTGVHIFDTIAKPSGPVPARPLMRADVPPCLAAKQASLCADGITFSAAGDLAAINWSAYDERGNAVGRWGNIIDLNPNHGTDAELLPAAKPGPAVKMARVLDHGSAFQRRQNPRGTVIFAGEDGFAIAAYPTAIHQLAMPDPQDPKGAIESVRYSGKENVLTAGRDRLLCAFEHKNPYFALLSQNRMRLWVPNGERTQPGLRRFNFQERRPHVLKALESLGLAPPPNRCTVKPWMDDTNRYLYLGLDEDVLLRLDLLPYRGKEATPALYPESDFAANPFALRPDATTWTRFSFKPL